MKTLLEMPKQTIKRGIPPAKRPFFCSVLFPALLFLFCSGQGATLFGQGITGSITGTVTDASGAAIAGATVTVRAIETNAIRTTTTSQQRLITL